MKVVKELPKEKDMGQIFTAICDRSATADELEKIDTDADYFLDLFQQFLKEKSEGDYRYARKLIKGY